MPSTRFQRLCHFVPHDKRPPHPSTCVRFWAASAHTAWARMENKVTTSTAREGGLEPAFPACHSTTTTVAALCYRYICPVPWSRGRLKCGHGVASGAHLGFPSGGHRRTDHWSRFLLPHLLGEHPGDQRGRGALRLRLSACTHGPSLLLRELHFLSGTGFQRTDLLLSKLCLAHAPRCLLVFSSRVFFVTGSGFFSPTSFFRGPASNGFLPLDFLLQFLHSHTMSLITPIHLGRVRTV